jgi:hypothetical protein
MSGPFNASHCASYKDVVLDRSAGIEGRFGR